MAKVARKYFLDVKCPEAVEYIRIRQLRRMNVDTKVSKGLMSVCDGELWKDVIDSMSPSDLKMLTIADISNIAPLDLMLKRDSPPVSPVYERDSKWKEARARARAKVYNECYYGKITEEEKKEAFEMIEMMSTSEIENSMYFPSFQKTYAMRIYPHQERIS